MLGYNLFLYCGNNPVRFSDDEGTFWDIALDVVFTIGSVINVIQNPTSGKAWAALGLDIICMAVPFVSGAGTALRATSKVDNVVDAGRATTNTSEAVNIVNNSKKIHGNSLKSTKETIGYALRNKDTHEIMKFGETTCGTKRYTKKFYNQNNIYMDQMEHGSKYDMHIWQHEQILEYTKRNGHRPPLNKSDW